MKELDLNRFQEFVYDLDRKGIDIPSHEIYDIRLAATYLGTATGILEMFVKTKRIIAYSSAIGVVFFKKDLDRFISAYWQMLKK